MRFYNTLENYLYENYKTFIFKLFVVNFLVFASLQELLSVPIYSLCILILLFPNLTLSKVPWSLIALTFAYELLKNWMITPPDIYLLFYVSLLLAISSFDQVNFEKIIYNNAKLIIGLCMFFATISKVTSTHYIENDLLNFGMLVDKRLINLARFFGGYTDENYNLNLIKMDYLNKGYLIDDASVSIKLINPPILKKITPLLSISGIIIEGLLAFLFLTPSRFISDRFRIGFNYFKHIIHLIFLFCVYFFLPVPSFGCTLAILGFVQCKEDKVLLKAAYIIAFFFIFLSALRLNLET